MAINGNDQAVYPAPPALTADRSHPAGLYSISVRLCPFVLSAPVSGCRQETERPAVAIPASTHRLLRARLAATARSA